MNGVAVALGFVLVVLVGMYPMLRLVDRMTGGKK